MAVFRTGLPAGEVDRRLRAAVEELRHAEMNAVLWFADVLERKLYRELGYSSVHLYAAEALGFSQSKTYQFLRLAQGMKKLPGVKASVARGDLSWTKARELVKVATPGTETRWIERARTSSRRELEREVAVVKARAKARRKEKAQGSLLEAGGVCGSDGGNAAVAARMKGEVTGNGDGSGNGSGSGSESGSGSGSFEFEVVKEIPVEVTLRFSPDRFAEFEAMLEAFRKRGGKGDREDVVMAGMRMVMKGQTDEPPPGEKSGGDGAVAPASTTKTISATGETSRPLTRINASPYQVVVHVCERCGMGEVTTSRGSKGVEPATLKRILCDARVHKRGEKNRSTVRPSVRMEVLARDHYRCQWRGCGSVQFVNVHHLVPRGVGGSNREDNLITLCGGCHRMLHRMEEKGYRPEGAKGSLVVREPKSSTKRGRIDAWHS